MSKRSTLKASDRLAYVTAALLLLYPLFCDLLPEAIARAFFISGTIICTLFFLRHRDFDLTSIGVGGLWLVLGAVALVSHLAFASSYKFTVLILVLTVLLMYMGTCSTRWIGPMLNVMLALLSIHLAATLTFYFFPETYAQFVKPVFFAADKNAVGYQSGLTNHYSDNGQMLAIGLVLSASFAICEKGHKERPWHIALTALFLFALLLTQKRAHLVFSLASVLFGIGFGSSRNRMLKVGIFICFVLLSVLFLANYLPGVSLSLDRLLGTFEGGDLEDTTSGRTLLWAAALEGWENNPWMGNGWSTYYYTWPSGLTVSIYAHNEILQLLYEVGILGTLLFCCAATSAFYVSCRVAAIMMRNDGCPVAMKRAALFACSYQVFALLYACTTGSLLQMITAIVPYFLAVSIMFAYRNDLSYGAENEEAVVA